MSAGSKQSGATDKVVPPELAHLMSLRPLETEDLSTASAKDHDKTSSNNSQVRRHTFHTTPSALPLRQSAPGGLQLVPLSLLAITVNLSKSLLPSKADEQGCRSGEILRFGVPGCRTLRMWYTPLHTARRLGHRAVPEQPPQARWIKRPALAGRAPQRPPWQTRVRQRQVLVVQQSGSSLLIVPPSHAVSSSERDEF